MHSTLSLALRLTTVLAVASAVVAHGPSALAQSDADANDAAVSTSGDEERGEAREEPALATPWRTFHGAFLKLARGDAPEAARSLVIVRRDAADHAAAVFARPVLNSLRDHPTVRSEAIPAESEWPPVGEHPAVRDRQSAVYDPNWAAYREAFVALADQNEGAARKKLAALRDEDHPTALLAAEILESISEAAPGAKTRRDRGGGAVRIVGESVGGLVGLGAGGTVGGLVGFTLAASNNQSGTLNALIAGLFFGTLGVGIGAAAATPLGTYLGGTIAGGTGQIGWSYLGGVLGAGAGLALLPATVNAPPLLVLNAALPIAGSMLGYELSRKPTAPSENRSAGTALRPFVTPPLGGRPATVGLELQF